MITRFDHAVIAVRDLDRALSLYRDVLGLDARPGGRHTGLGTHNGIVRFGLDYLELLTVYDRAEAEAGGPVGTALVDYLARREGGLVGYCLATNAMEKLAQQARQTGLDVVGPFAMERARPDGRVLRWQLLVPGGTAWRRPWPFMIHWGIPDQERLAWEQPGSHPLGVTGVAGVAVVVHDLDAAKSLYGRQLGLALDSEAEVPELAARCAHFKIGSFVIDLLAPAGSGPARAELNALGEGPFQVTLRVHNLQQARAWLDRSAVVLGPAPGTPRGWLVPPDHALGARLVLVEAA
jgi:catechol 2,3-dioxygenase-like lactoylglutathione lyase family enzyme